MKQQENENPLESSPSSFFGESSNCSPLLGSLNKTALHNSRHSFSGRSSQSIPGIRSDYNVVKSFGFPLPVVVNEALTSVGSAAGTVSAKVAQNGLAWVVHGRRLLIWQYKESSKGAKHPRREGGLPQCRELQLPYSDLGYNSELISVFQTDGQQMASCIAVSATGDVRYWPSIAHDGNTVNLPILTGQDFVQIINLPLQEGYLAVTSTSTLVFLSVGVTNGRYSLHHKTIKPATSLLGGFGSDKDPLLVGMCCEINSPEGETVKVTVLSDRSIQRWSLSSKGNTEHLLHKDEEVVRRISEEFKQKFWNLRTPADNVEIELHLLDFHIVDDKAYILAGAVNAAHAPQMCYAVAVASVQANSILLESFTPLKLNKFYNAKTKEDCVSLRFIIGSSHIYLYTPKVVYPLLLENAVPTAELEAEKIEFHLHDDRILCAAVCSRLPLFFSRTHGLVSITPGDFDANELHNMSTCNTPDLFEPAMLGSFSAPDQSALSAVTGSSNNLHMFELDPDELYSDRRDEVGQLKAAFVYHLKRNNSMVKTIIGELLRTVNEPDQCGAPLDAYKLDRIVITIAEDLAEDLPIADSRWEEALGDHHGNRHALGSSRSMQIINQLRDKTLAFDHFVSFLHASGIWEKLNAIPCGSNVLKPTSFILSDISEKIVAAMALRSLQAKQPEIIEHAIDATVAMWDEKPNGNLTTQDIFYVKLCKFQFVFKALAEMADNQISAQRDTIVMVAQFLNDTNSIVLDTLGQVFMHREQQANNFTPNNDRLAACENLPWTAMSGSAGVLDTLNRLIDLSLRYGYAQCISEAELSQKLYQQIYELVDLVLEGRKSYLECSSVRGSEKANLLQQQFEAQRRELISVLIKDLKYEYAAKLAEKYLDFHSLVLICDVTNDKERLDDYMRKYEEFDFSQFAIRWYLRQKRHGEVFERFKDNPAALAQFMRDHPSLVWIQLIFNGDYEQAAKVLYELAQNEEIVARKKSMLSLAKQAAFAAPDTDLTLQKINADLRLIKYQLQLSHDVLQNSGLDPVEQKVLKAEDIIDLYIADENESATDVEFGKALELLSFVEQPYDLRHKIWCAAIRRDNWIYDPNNAVEYIQKLLFFKIIEISHVKGQEGDNFLPPMEEFLESTELVDLPQNKSFQNLLKLTYEYVADKFKQPQDMKV
ncbi:nuclear pore complex protein Nup133-like [Drosophila miranda]|uniref:nuclear pore complex protein Nup133-like n=1 Tax=Drosophila miranda TaxID=7229 RepID=UPI00143F49D8|nr:nuclear pore complex protein Nup133-like [Drosophila miranda]